MTRVGVPYRGLGHRMPLLDDPQYDYDQHDYHHHGNHQVHDYVGHLLPPSRFSTPSKGRRKGRGTPFREASTIHECSPPVFEVYPEEPLSLFGDRDHTDILSPLYSSFSLTLRGRILWLWLAPRSLSSTSS
jgi:hypothetical protein